MDPLELARLRPLMARGEGRSEVVIGLIDGPVALDHPGLSEAKIRELPGAGHASCLRADSVACTHATFVAGMLVAKRGSPAPAICPGCTLSIRPIFTEATSGNQMPSADPEGLATAIIESVGAGARLINLSAALIRPTPAGERKLHEALDYTMQRGALVIAAAGNQATISSSALTRHAWVIPVAGCDYQGIPTPETNLGNSIGRRGLAAPGQGITSLGTNGGFQTLGGTSAAAPFVTGTLALLWSEFPAAPAGEVKLAIMQSSRRGRTGLVPPLLDAWAAYQHLAAK